MNQISVLDIHQEKGKFKIFLFNVGQGDNLLIKFPGGEYGIIDFYYDSGIKMFEPPSISYFKCLKDVIPVEEFEKITISFFCVSHTDKDHVKGVAKGLKWFYENNLFIKDFWFGAARDEAQIMQFIKEKLPAMVKNMDDNDQIDLYQNIRLYENGIEEFFEYFNKWKSKEFKGERYKIDEIGIGKYLSEIRSLGLPSPDYDVQAINMGPLNGQLDEYLKELEAGLIKKVFAGLKDPSYADKNLLSPILRLRYGNTNIYFGGDTHKNIWEKCLKEYEKPTETHKKDFGPLTGIFVKVSHHGSRNSSSLEIWKKILPTDKPSKVHFGISAGAHKKFNHPHAETFKHIREVKKESSIYSTNICYECLDKATLDRDYHAWYDEYMKKSAVWTEAYSDQDATEISALLHGLKKGLPEANCAPENFGLLAYTFEIPDDLEKEVLVRMAVAKSLRRPKCIYHSHEVKTCPACNVEYAENEEEEVNSIG